MCKFNLPAPSQTEWCWGTHNDESMWIQILLYKRTNVGSLKLYRGLAG